MCWPRAQGEGGGDQRLGAGGQGRCLNPSGLVTSELGGLQGASFWPPGSLSAPHGPRFHFGLAVPRQGNGIAELPVWVHSLNA